MDKEKYIKTVNESKNLDNVGKEILLKQIEKYYEAKNNNIDKDTYDVEDEVKLKQGTLIHGTYKNIEGLKEIINNGLISSWFIDGRLSKYPSSVGVWNLKKDYYLKDYINFYSGGTIMFNGENKKNTRIISYDDMSNIMNIVSNEKDYHMWYMEQTKESRFIPSYTQDNVQTAVIFNGDNPYIKKLLKGDILNPENISDDDVKPFVNEKYYDRFIIDRKNKDDFFTDRESAILFGIPSNLIEGVLVGRKYEKDDKILKEIKSLIPDAYICNLDGKVIVGNK